MKKLSILAIIALLFASCNTDEDANRNSELGNPTFGNVTFTFANEVDGEPLQLGSTTYVNSNNETYSVSDLKYIISNIVLINDNGLDYVVPEEDSYFIIDQQLSSSLTIKTPPDERSTWIGGYQSRTRFTWHYDPHCSNL